MRSNLTIKGVLKKYLKGFIILEMVELVYNKIFIYPAEFGSASINNEFEFVL